MPLFRKSETKPNSPQDSGPVTRIRNTDEWTSFLAQSGDEPVLIFKHSTVCGISSSVLSDITTFVNQTHPTTPFGLIHVVEDRSLSNAIAEQTGIRHESPQLIAFHHGHPTWHASHWSIDLDDLDRHLTL
jgi:bacillithiol system protein YtxJ